MQQRAEGAAAERELDWWFKCLFETWTTGGSGMFTILQPNYQDLQDKQDWVDLSLEALFRYTLSQYLFAFLVEF